jgi:hypothetical protein
MGFYEDFVKNETKSKNEKRERVCRERAEQIVGEYFAT